MKCFYHGSDFDGECSAAIVNRADPDCILIPIDYGQSDSHHKIGDDEEIVVVDYTFQPFQKMLSFPDTLVWIDHHQSAIEEADKYNFNPLGVRKVGTAACELTWSYFFPDERIPEAVSLIGKYDVWELNDNVIHFQYGLKTFQTDPYSPIWDSLFNDSGVEVSSIIHMGKLVDRYITRDNERYVHGFGFEVIFEGLNCICCNRGLTGSKLFDSIWDDKTHDVMMTFCRTKHRFWRVSLYTPYNGINCGTIAKKYGGGGHAKAAGFTCKELPFDI